MKYIAVAMQKRKLNMTTTREELSHNFPNTSTCSSFTLINNIDFT